MEGSAQFTGRPLIDRVATLMNPEVIWCKYPLSLGYYHICYLPAVKFLIFPWVLFVFDLQLISVLNVHVTGTFILLLQDMKTGATETVKIECSVFVDSAVKWEFAVILPRMFQTHHPLHYRHLAVFNSTSRGRRNI